MSLPRGGITNLRGFVFVAVKGLPFGPVAKGRLPFFPVTNGVGICFPVFRFPGLRLGTWPRKRRASQAICGTVSATTSAMRVFACRLVNVVTPCQEVYSFGLCLCFRRIPNHIAEPITAPRDTAAARS